MDPLSIAASSSAIAGLCVKVAGVIFTFVGDTRTVDSSVSDLLQEILGLSRVSEAISQTWTQHPMIATGETSSNGSLWASVKASIDDCKNTLRKLDAKLDEVQAAGFLGGGILRKPTKLVKLNMKMKDILLFKQQVHSYNNAMQSALQMINVCLLLHSNSSQESIEKVLAGLKTQLARVEFALGERGDGESSTDGTGEDDVRIRRNLQGLVQAAESFHSDASVALSDGANSTIWGGSVMGEPLNADQLRRIQNWISPPILEENENLESSPSPTGTMTRFGSPRAEKEDHTEVDSDADSDDWERQLMAKFEELAMKSLQQKDFKKAETFLRKLIDGAEQGDKLSADITSLKTWLAFACGYQGKWEEAENILVPIAMAKGAVSLMALTSMIALALVHLRAENYYLAIKYCKRAIWGAQKFQGKSSLEYYESMALLVHIYETKGDLAEAEGCKSFIPEDHSDTFSRSLVLEPLTWIETILNLYLPSFRKGEPFLQTPTASEDSISVSRRLSSSSPLLPERPLNLVSERLDSAHDKILSSLGSLIRHCLIKPQSTANLRLIMGQSVMAGGFLLKVVEVVCSHDTQSPQALRQALEKGRHSVNQLSLVARGCIRPGWQGNYLRMASELDRLKDAATDCAIASGDCVAKARLVIERMGDFELDPKGQELSIDVNIYEDSVNTTGIVKQATVTPSSDIFTNTQLKSLNTLRSNFTPIHSTHESNSIAKVAHIGIYSDISREKDSTGPERSNDTSSDQPSNCIRFIQHQDAGDPSPFEFSPISRTLPTGNEYISVRRYNSNYEVESNAPTNDVRFKSRVVSRRHCVIWSQDGMCYIKDVQSASGTFLNGVRLSAPGEKSKRFPIVDGDIIQLGVTHSGKGDDMFFRCVKIRIEFCIETARTSPNNTSSTTASVAENSKSTPPVQGNDVPRSRYDWFRRRFT